MMQLDVYSNSFLNKRQLKCLNDGINSTVHKAISLSELNDIYSKSDIALHVESFDLKNRLAVRLSFSTKIIDCLASGCATVAICHKSQSGFQYLKTNDVALCCDNLNQLEQLLNTIIKSPNILCDVQKRAVDFGKLNHSEKIITKELCADFCRVVHGEV